MSSLPTTIKILYSRVHTETIFNLGLGDMFSIRIAGNIVSEQALGSMEFDCVVAGAKLIRVLGHTSCGALTQETSCSVAGYTTSKPGRSNSSRTTADQ